MYDGAGADAPDLQHVVRARREQARAVRREGERRDGARVPEERRDVPVRRRRVRVVVRRRRARLGLGVEHDAIYRLICGARPACACRCALCVAVQMYRRRVRRGLCIVVPVERRPVLRGEMFHIRRAVRAIERVCLSSLPARRRIVGGSSSVAYRGRWSQAGRGFAAAGGLRTIRVGCERLQRGLRFLRRARRSARRPCLCAHVWELDRHPCCAFVTLVEEDCWSGRRKSCGARSSLSSRRPRATRFTIGDFPDSAAHAHMEAALARFTVKDKCIAATCGEAGACLK